MASFHFDLPIRDEPVRLAVDGRRRLAVRRLDETEILVVVVRVAFVGLLAEVTAV
jgi:hypothetical protein